MTSQESVAVAIECDPWQVIDRATAGMKEVRALAKPRRGVDAQVRDRIGDRDGWVCCICAEPVDRSLRYLQATAKAVKQFAADLEGYGVQDFREVVAWIGQDADRAQAAEKWLWQLRGAGAPDRDADRAGYWQVVRQNAPAFEEASSELFKTVRPLREARTRHNNLTASTEHIHPVSLGGSNDEANLAIAHRGCNIAGRYTDEERKRLGAVSIQAQDFLREVSRLRDARKISERHLLRVFGEVRATLQANGLAVEHLDDVAEHLPPALAVVCEQYRDLWTARREFEMHCWYLMIEPGEVTRKRLLIELDRINKKLGSLKRPHAITRWEARRDATESQLIEIERGQVDRRQDYYKFRELSGHAHDAAWWRAQRADLPPLSNREALMLINRDAPVDETR